MSMWKQVASLSLSLSYTMHDSVSTEVCTMTASPPNYIHTYPLHTDRYGNPYALCCNHSSIINNSAKTIIQYS